MFISPPRPPTPLPTMQPDKSYRFAVGFFRPLNNLSCYKTAGAKSYLNATASLLLQQYVLRLHITMDDFVFIQGVQTQEEAVSKFANQLEAEAHKFVFLYKLIEVYREELKCNTRMRAEGEVVEHMDDVHSIVFVLFPEVFEDADLLLRLPVEPLLIPDDLEGHVQVTLVIVGLHHLPEAPLAYDFEHLVPVLDVVVRNVGIRPLVVVVPIIRGDCLVPRPYDTWPLLRIGAYEVDLWIVKDFFMFVRSKFVHIIFHDLFRGSYICLWLSG